jgi:hypothetical protein
MYVGSCCTPLEHEGPRCCCGAIYDHGWNTHCTGDDCTANPKWFPNPAKKAVVAPMISLQLKAVHASGTNELGSHVSELSDNNATVGQPRSKPECCMFKDWDGCLAKSIKNGSQSACETISCSRDKTCPGAPNPHTTGDWCNSGSWTKACTSGWVTGCACQM